VSRPAYLALVLHAHLPFVRHPEHERFLEESWLFEAVSECYLPLLRLLEGWNKVRLPVRLTLSLSPTLCSMLQDPLLQERCRRHLDGLIELAEKEVFRTHWDRASHELACFYRERSVQLRQDYENHGGNLVAAFRKLQAAGGIELITCAATHALLPLLLRHPPSLRAQVLVARDHYRACFGCDPRGIWLPECAYAPGVETVLREANLRWFILDTHGLTHARPRPRYGVFAPIFTPAGVAALGRDPASARQVWSRHEGYPGDPRYRDFYRDIGFDLDLDYVRPHLFNSTARTFTGIKYHRVTGAEAKKELYQRDEALRAAETHAAHFLQARLDQAAHLASLMEQPPLLVAPYDAELFGHWWFEGPEFLDLFVRKAAATTQALKLVTPTDYLRQRPTHQVATPSASTWGEGGHLKMWLNEKNAWLYPHLRAAQARMTGLVRRHPKAGALVERALRQAGRELLLAQASDWPFILTTGTSPDYARQRITTHLARFTTLHEQLQNGVVDEAKLREIEEQDNVFPELDYRYWE
jgi:1,4-alpha-glucan branching enzyme